MKKTILISYVNHKDIASISKRERTFKKVFQKLSDEGAKLVELSKDSRSQLATFDDGSIIHMVSFGVMTGGCRFTHLYLDKEAYEMPNGEEYINKVLLPQMSGEFESEGLQERIKLFETDYRNEVHFQPYFG